MPRVFVACEFSGTVRDAFRALGYDAVSCDLLPSEAPGPHIRGDARDHLADGWDILVAHPPCTYLCNSGVRWLYGGSGSDRDPVRWKLMEEGAALFRAFLDAPIPRIAVENPIMHRYAKEIVGKPVSQLIQPWHFGDGETKATGLWLKGLPPLMSTMLVDDPVARVHRLPPSADRWKKRSVTMPGIAKAMADQWGSFGSNHACRL